MLSCVERVMAGAEMLDTVNPGWEKKVRVESLYLENPHQCVLGQLYGEYSCGANRLEIGLRLQAALGFIADAGVGWSALNYEWKREINRRLALSA